MTRQQVSRFSNDEWEMPHPAPWTSHEATRVSLRVTKSIPSSVAKGGAWGSGSCQQPPGHKGASANVAPQDLKGKRVEPQEAMEPSLLPLRFAGPPRPELKNKTKQKKPSRPLVTTTPLLYPRKQSEHLASPGICEWLTLETGLG